MSTPPTGPTQGENDADPTGMRDVLASLSDPAPMPRQLADRICASLAQEHQARVGAPGWHPTTGPAVQDAAVHDFAAEKAHRRPQQWIMAAAAVLAVGVIGTVVFDQFINNSPDSSSVAAQANAGNSESDSAGGDSAESDDEGSDAGSEAAPGDQDSQRQDEDSGEAKSEAEADAAAPADDASQPTGIASLGDAAFALGAQALLSTTASEVTGDDITDALSLPDSLDVQVDSVAPLDSTELDNCAQAAGGSSGESWLGLAATINGEEVVVLGDKDAESSAATQAWALDSSCPQNASAAVLKGPVQLP